MKFPITVFPYKFSLKRLLGSPITFTILPITIKDFPYNFIVVSLCIVFPYYFHKYGMYFPRKSLQTFSVYCVTTVFTTKFNASDVIFLKIDTLTCIELVRIQLIDLHAFLFYETLPKHTRLQLNLPFLNKIVTPCFFEGTNYPASSLLVWF